MEIITNLTSITGIVLTCVLYSILPLIIGIMKDKKILAFVGFFVSAIFGVVMTTVFYRPVALSIIPSVIFTVIILVSSRKK